ncbi:MAG: DUF1207 domain-containing protein, partial [Candidatus Binatia bacterium]
MKPDGEVGGTQARWRSFLPCMLSPLVIALSSFLLIASSATADEPVPGTATSLAYTRPLAPRDMRATLHLFSHDSYVSDALLLQHRLDRATLSYDEILLTLSYDMFDTLMFQAGGGLLIDQQPAQIAPGTARFGVDFASPWLFDNETVLPLVSSEVKMHQEYQWSSDFSLRAGVRFKSSHTSTV